MKDKNYYLTKKDGKKLFINILENDKNSPNIIFIQTPICSVTEMKDTYYSLSKYGFNVFALDLYGSGKSDGSMAELSIETVHEDLSACIDYVIKNYNDVIHFYAGNGIGGMLAQHYLSQETPVRSFVQYGVAIHGDVSIFKQPVVIKACYPFMLIIAKIFPNFKIKYEKVANLEGYKGKNAEKEYNWYKEKMKKYPGAFDMQMSFLSTLLKMFLSKKSFLKYKPMCPVLVVAPKYDRFVDFSYYQKYYNWLDNPKQIFEIDDSHISFEWHAEEICKVASEWFKQFS